MPFLSYALVRAIPSAEQANTNSMPPGTRLQGALAPGLESMMCKPLSECDMIAAVDVIEQMSLARSGGSAVKAQPEKSLQSKRPSVECGWR